MNALSDDELKGLTPKFRERLAKGETLDDLLPEAFAACREAGRRTKNMRHFDVQILGGIVLHRGNIAEMVTGEGKTLVATLPAYLNALEGKGVHVVTVNDYLARRDCEWMLPIYHALGITAGYIQRDMDPVARRQAYDCDITYGTNSEFGFDYLRDNMKPARCGDDQFHPYYHQVQRLPLNFAIIDEVDNILIDEARTPLIISGPAFSDAQPLRPGQRDRRPADRAGTEGPHGTDATPASSSQRHRRGRPAELAAARPAKVDPQNPPPKGVLFRGQGEGTHLPPDRRGHPQGRGTGRRRELLHRRQHGMAAPDRQRPQGAPPLPARPPLHDRTGPARGRTSSASSSSTSSPAGHVRPAVVRRPAPGGRGQARRDGVKIKEETQTLATVTLQNFFKLYKKLAGMTGTAMTEANEFWKIYKLDVIAIPTNKPLLRVNHPRPGLPHREGEVGGGGRRDRRGPQDAAGRS